MNYSQMATERRVIQLFWVRTLVSTPIYSFPPTFAFDMGTTAKLLCSIIFLKLGPFYDCLSAQA